MSNLQTFTYEAGAITDAVSQVICPGAVAIQGGKIISFGDQSQVRREVGSRAAVRQLGNYLILPQFVTAHAHLDLTPVGQMSYSGAFVQWLQSVMNARAQTDEALNTSIQKGVCAAAEAGVGWIGDIVNSPGAIAARSEAKLAGISFLECFGIGMGQEEGCLRLVSQLQDLDASANQLGLQPHAPYSAGHQVYQRAVDLAIQFGFRLSTHLAESKMEEQFLVDASGPIVDHLKAIGKWDTSIKASGLHPVDWMKPYLEKAEWLLAHCNYVDDDHIKLIADCGASVAYCPIASDYFGHHHHRYRDMMAAGVNVCLGTDSILCQPRNEFQPLSILAQMRHLYRRDRTSPRVLLELATINGCRALGLDPSLATLQPGVQARMCAVPIDPDNSNDPLAQVLENDYPVRSIGFSETLL